MSKKNVPKNLFGQVGKGVGIFEFLGSDLSCGKLHLNEVEPDCWFILNVRTQLHFRKCSRCSKIMTDLLSHEEGL
jgi:hypothetical protein